MTLERRIEPELIQIGQGRTEDFVADKSEQTTAIGNYFGMPPPIRLPNTEEQPQDS
jgi:hypothetical protein